MRRRLTALLSPASSFIAVEILSASSVRTARILVASSKYDPFGRRIYKSSSTTTSVYAYDGDHLVEETNSSGTAVARYVQTQNIDEPLAMLRSGATSYYHADSLGSVTSLSSSAGAIANTYTYDSFGNLTASTGSITNPFRYTAREFDTETSLYYYRARYYAPATGRFMSEDPLKFFGGEVNFYRYVWNDPANFRDPHGLWGAGASVGGSFYGGVPTNQGTGISGFNSVGGVLFIDPSAPGGFTPSRALGFSWTPNCDENESEITRRCV